MITLSENIKYNYNELEKIYFQDNKKFLVTYRKIYQLNFSSNIKDKFYTINIYNKLNGLPLMKKGYHKFANAKEINDLLEFELVVD